MQRGIRSALSTCYLLALASTAEAAAPDHFHFYQAKTTKGASKPVAFAPVTLTDQIRAADYVVAKPLALGLPADENGEGVRDPLSHLIEYQLKAAKGAPKFRKVADVTITNQCNVLRMELQKPVSLLVPTAQGPTAPTTPDLDHFVCYAAKPQKKLGDGTKLPPFPKGLQVEVADGFQARRYDLKRITKVCAPAAASGAPFFVSGPQKGTPAPFTPAAVQNPADHLVCYQASLATKLVAQTGCGPTTPGDPGAKIDPKQTKHQTVSVVMTNDFGTLALDASKELDLCLPSLAVVARPAAATDDIYQGIGNTPLKVGRTGAPAVEMAGSVLDNDPNPEDDVTVTGVSGVTAGASVDMGADGTFTYLGPAGFTGTDTFTYTISDGTSTDSATVTITLLGRAWYLDASFSGTSDGRATAPFVTLQELAGAGEANDYLFVFPGTYDGGIALKPGQVLAGRRLSVGSTVVISNTVRPTIVNTVPTGDAVTLADDATVRGFALGPATRNALRVENLAKTVTATDLAIQSTGSHAILAHDSARLVVDDVVIDDAGSVGTNHAFDLGNTSAVLRNVDIVNPATSGINFVNASPLTLHVVISDTSVSGAGRLATANAIQLVGAANSRTTAVFDRISVVASADTNFGLAVGVLDTATVTQTITNATFNATGAAGTGGITLQSAGSGTLRYDVISNTVSGTPGPAITLVNLASAVSAGRIRGNTVTGTVGTQNGIFVRNQSDGDLNVLVDRNTVTGFAVDPVRVLVDGTGTGRTDARILDNLVGAPTVSGNGSRVGIQSAGATLCLDLQGNDLTGTSAADIGLTQTAGTAIANDFTSGDLATFVGTRNGGASAFVSGTWTGGVCLAPPPPLPE